MSSPPHTRADPASTITADIRQLTEPIHLAVRGRIITHPPLLDQLRAATTPGQATTGPSRPAPTSRPPARLDAVDVLAEVYTGIAAWRIRLHLPSPPRYRHSCYHDSCRRILLDRTVDRRTDAHGPPCRVARLTAVDWQLAVLHTIGVAAGSLEPTRADWLAVEAHQWWHDAAVACGWQPKELIRIR